MLEIVTEGPPQTPKPPGPKQNNLPLVQYQSILLGGGFKHLFCYPYLGFHDLF